MSKTRLGSRIVFIALCAGGSWLICYTVGEWDHRRGLAIAVGLMIGSLVVLVDLMLKGFSLRRLTALTFGLAIGPAIAWLIGTSPLLNPLVKGDQQNIYLGHMALFVISTYLGPVIHLVAK